MSLALGFARDVGCRADLLWRCDLVDGTQTAAWVALATAAGFSSVPGSSRLGVAVLEEPGSGHRIVAVLRTGRLQIRLDAMTPKPTRVLQARRLFDRLRALEAPVDSPQLEAP
ncbi:MAG: hypothetical protein ACRBN8_42570 [Nannocystales bacterium]